MTYEEQLKAKLLAKQKDYRRSQVNRRKLNFDALVDEDITAIFTRNDEEETEAINDIFCSLPSRFTSYDR